VNALLLWLAQGFGIGRIPKAPGTFGSVVGLGWFALLLLSGGLRIFLIGCLVGVALSVWLCGVGEKVLRAKDPGSVVFDEIAAIPVCFIGWIAVHISKTGAFPTPEYFFSKQNILPTLGVFAAFRFFDVLKPWPVRQSQSLPGGWGVTIDDTLAAVYVNVVVLAVLFITGGR
jgi:phosphatidylglycerophosphatase A